MVEAPKYLAVAAVSAALGLWAGSSFFTAEAEAEVEPGVAEVRDQSGGKQSSFQAYKPAQRTPSRNDLVAGREECPSCPKCPRIAEDVNLEEFLDFDFERQTKNGDAPKFSGLSREELEELAEKCEVRTEGIPETIPEGLSSFEKRAWENAADETRAWYREEAGHLYETYVGEIPEEANLRDLWKGPQSELWRVGDMAVFRQRVAQERAGLADPPAQVTDAEKLYRLWHGRADKFEELLGEQVGAARAAELRANGAFPPQDTEIGCPRAQ